MIGVARGDAAYAAALSARSRAPRVLTELLTSQRKHDGTRRYRPAEPYAERVADLHERVRVAQASTSWYLRRATHNPSGRRFESTRPTNAETINSAVNCADAHVRG